MAQKWRFCGQRKMGHVMHLCRHIADCNMWLAVKGLQYTDIAPDGEDNVPSCATPWVH